MNRDARQKFDLGYTVSGKEADMDQLMELIYQSNLIENISDYWVGTVSEGEELIIKPTITDHIDALLMASSLNNLNLNQEEVKRTHNSLMKNLMKKPGEYRSKGNSYMKSKGEFVSGNPIPGHVVPLMDSWLEKTLKAEKFDDILNLHYEFEVIHPFPDGNGRTGRLLLNWMTLQKLDRYTIIENKHKKEYYKNIQNYRQEFMKNHPNVIFTTYEMLSKEEKKRLKKEKTEYYKDMKNLFS